MSIEDHKKLRWYKLVILFICFFAYLFLGAVIFHYIESDNEHKLRSDVHKAKYNLLRISCLEEDELEDFVETVKAATASGIDPRGNSTNPSNWDYASAFFFSVTVVTTIGYGKSVPTTDLGRNICLLYALFGIPFTGWLLSTVGNFYCATFHKISGIIETFIRHHLGVKHRRLRKSALYFVCFIISYGVIVILPALVFYLMERWPFEIAHYYAFITLSTIGFGDYVAAANPHHPRNQKLLWVYDIFVAFWYVIGLSYLACIITAVGRQQKQTITRVRTTIRDHLASEEKVHRSVEYGVSVLSGTPGVIDGALPMKETSFTNNHNNEVPECQCQCHQSNEGKFNYGYSVKEIGTQTDIKL